MGGEVNVGSKKGRAADLGLDRSRPFRRFPRRFGGSKFLSFASHPRGELGRPRRDQPYRFSGRCRYMASHSKLNIHHSKFFFPTLKG